MKRIPQIQALRAVAALLVVAYHAKLTPGGYIGVDIFYVISGYLITGLLLRELESTGTLKLKAFYLRRIKRLLPTSFFVLIVTAIAAWALYPSTLRPSLGKDIAAAAAYVSNYLFALWQMDYQNLNATPPVVIHYWSLAVEEQFYLFWPFIILALFRYGSRRAVLLGVSAITSLSFLLSLYLTAREPIWSFYSLPTRAWELGLGALLLFIPKKIRFSSNYAWIALALLTYGTFAYTDSTPFPGTAALVPVLGTSFAIACANNWPKSLDSMGNTRIVQWLGEISYPLYLWHWPVLVIPSVTWGRSLTYLEILLCVLATLILADLTHRFIEDPIRYSKPQSRTIVQGGALATAFSLALGTVIYFSWNDRIKLDDGTSFSVSEVTKRPIVYDDGCHVNNGEVQSPDCTYGEIGAKRKIVLFGDSHAAQWFPALEDIAKRENFELISLTKSACPGPAVLKVDSGEYKNADCFAWRENSFQRIEKLKPYAVIFSGFQHFEIPNGYSSRREWWQEGQRKTFKALEGNARHIIYMTDTPHPEQDIPNCLAGGVIEQCNDTKPSEPISIPGLKSINPTSWLCDEECKSVINGIVAYRDGSHISRLMSASLAGQLKVALRRVGVL
jgi:peptidoglycan/LPS O-acetylase OafA/YrhL